MLRKSRNELVAIDLATQTIRWRTATESIPSPCGTGMALGTGLDLATMGAMTGALAIGTSLGAEGAMPPPALGRFLANVLSRRAGKEGLSFIPALRRNG